MQVFIFSSKTIENIRIGVAAGLWAVPVKEGPLAQGRHTRAESMPIGAAGLFYASDVKVFTVPFIVESEPIGGLVENVWKGTWELPFKIRPIGNIENQVSSDRAAVRWRFWKESDNRGGIVTAARAFAPENISRPEWDVILEDVGVDPEQHEDRW